MLETVPLYNRCVKCRGSDWVHTRCQSVTQLLPESPISAAALVSHATPLLKMRREKGYGNTTYNDLYPYTKQKNVARPNEIAWLLIIQRHQPPHAKYTD